MNEIEIIATIGSVNARTRSVNQDGIDMAVHAMAANIVATYERASASTERDGAAWYGIAQDWCRLVANESGLSLAKVAAIVAVTSPRCSWETNLARALAFIRHGETVGLFAWQAERLPQILAADDIDVHTYVRGPKVSRFFRNIVGQYAPVAVDIWAIRVATGWLGANDNTYKVMVGTPTRYELIEQAYQIAAAHIGQHPAIVQAVTWVQVRDVEAGGVANDVTLDAIDNLPDNI